MGNHQHGAISLPAEVAALVGEFPRRLVGYGAAAALGGRGMVAKVGPAAIVAREARILGGDLGGLPLEVPELVAAGLGWLVMREVSDHGGAWDQPGFAALLGDLARLHDGFESSPALAGGWLRDPAAADLAATIAEGGDQTGIELPDALARVRADPGPVAQLLARSGPLTLVQAIRRRGTCFAPAGGGCGSTGNGPAPRRPPLTWRAGSLKGRGSSPAASTETRR